MNSLLPGLGTGACPDYDRPPVDRSHDAAGSPGTRPHSGVRRPGGLAPALALIHGGHVMKTVVASFCALLVAAATSVAGPKEDLANAWSKGAAALAKQQREDGGWSLKGLGDNSDVAITGLALAALAGSEEGKKTYADAIAKACAYLVKNQAADGSIANEGAVPKLTNYKTSIAMTALATVDKAKYKDVLDKGAKWLVAFQYQENGPQKADKNDPNYGGAGYDEKKDQPRGDMSNTTYMLEALEAAGVPKDSEVWKRALTFVQRCQNRSESNDGPGFDKLGVVVGDDGGFFYRPGESKAEKETLPNGKQCFRSYGSMTYEGYKSMIYAGLSKDDPRVKAALGWIAKNYTLDENPGMKAQGYFYYLHAFASALDAAGVSEIKDADGETHKWAEELATKLAGLQKEDGNWAGDPRWWEDMQPLPTLYALLSLNRAAKHVK